jgi:hypothetical protein
MNSPDKKKGNLKKKIFHEVAEYLINVAYLSLMFAAFTQYRRLILAAHDIAYTNYWVAVIEALILAKVIMIGDAFRLGRGFEDRPLIYPTVYKAVVFSIFVAVFKLIEHTIKGLWKGEGIMVGLVDLSEKGLYVILANSLVVLVAFIPFFAVKELGRVLGENKIGTLFFRRREEQ